MYHPPSWWFFVIRVFQKTKHRSPVEAELLQEQYESSGPESIADHDGFALRTSPALKELPKAGDPGCSPRRRFECRGERCPAGDTVNGGEPPPSPLLKKIRLKELATPERGGGDRERKLVGTVHSRRSSAEHRR